jgi:hypothetical protein
MTGAWTRRYSQWLKWQLRNSNGWIGGRSIKKEIKKEIMTPLFARHAMPSQKL